MSKSVKNGLIVIAIIAVLFAIVWFAYDIFKKEPTSADVNTNLVDENTGLYNIINDLFENDVENKIEKNVVEEKKENTVESSDTQNQNDKKQENKEVTTSTTESVTSREEKAIELVKKEWGSTDGVYFSNESVDSNGRYIVSVRDKKTTTSLAFYLVDIDKKLVTEQ